MEQNLTGVWIVELEKFGMVEIISRVTITLVSVCIMVCCKDCPLYGKQCSGMRLDLTCEEIVGKYYVNLVLTNKYGDDWKFNIVYKKENK